MFSSKVAGLAECPEEKGGNDVGALKKVGVVTDFSELHDEVHEVLCADRVGQIVRLRDEVGNRNALAKSFVDVPLALTQVDEKVDFDLCQRSANSSPPRDDVPYPQAPSARAS